MRKYLRRCVLALGMTLFLSGGASAQTSLVKDGSAKSVIVVQERA
jgi:hypothetical protein